MSDSESSSLSSNSSSSSSEKMVQLNPKKTPKKGDKTLVGDKSVCFIWTDGAVPNNGFGAQKGGGIGVFFENDPEKNISVQYSEYYDGRKKGERVTNNRCELLAIALALEKACDLYAGRIIKIHTDSQYSFNGVTKWAKGWERNDWKKRNGGPVKNVDLFKRIMKAEKRFKKARGSVHYERVPGHAGVPGNEEADRLANLALGIEAKPSKALDFDGVSSDEGAGAASPKSVWVVTTSESDTGGSTIIVGIFTTKKGAQEALNVLNGDGSIEALELNKINI
jgi:ribonuclease HI